MSDQPVNKEKYEGPGRIASALGDSDLYMMGGGVVGAVAGAGASALILRDNGRMVGYCSEHIKNVGMRMNGKVPIIMGAAFLIAGVVATVSGIVGLVHGWNKGVKGKKQFESLKAENELLTHQFANAVQSRGQAGHASALASETTSNEQAR